MKLWSYLFLPDEISAFERSYLRRMNRIGGFDVLVLSRGGGSLEDLWPFNEEVVARAVAESAIPVISAVGHEVDFTIADFVADVRAPTPSAAAEMVVASKEDLNRRIDSLAARLRSAVRVVHGGLRDRVSRLGRSRALFSTRGRLEAFSQRLDDANASLRAAIRALLVSRRRRVELSTERISPRALSAGVASRRQHLADLIHRSALGAGSLERASRERWRALSSLLHSLSPLAVLDRGYALCLDPDTGRPVTDSRRLPPSHRVDVRLRQGRIGCDIREVSHAQNDPERP